MIYHQYHSHHHQDQRNLINIHQINYKAHSTHQGPASLIVYYSSSITVTEVGGVHSLLEPHSIPKTFFIT